MHRLVLEDRVRRLRANEPRHGRIFDGGRLQSALDTLVASQLQRPQLGCGRPLVVVAPRLVEVRRIDTAFEETLETGVDRGLAQPAFVERKKAKRRNVPFVERERMAQRNRPFVERSIVDRARRASPTVRDSGDTSRANGRGLTRRR